MKLPTNIGSRIWHTPAIENGLTQFLTGLTCKFCVIDPPTGAEIRQIKDLVVLRRLLGAARTAVWINEFVDVLRDPPSIVQV